MILPILCSVSFIGCSNATLQSQDDVVHPDSLSAVAIYSAPWPTNGPPAAFAKSEVKSFVLSQLVQPHSATFGVMTCEKSGNAFRNKNGSWEVKFWIEAKNSFGATMRRNAYVFVDNSGTPINEPDVGSGANPTGILHSFDEGNMDENARISRK